MGFVIFELLLWAGLIYLFWSMRDKLVQMETELQQAQIKNSRPGMPVFSRPDKLFEQIGTFLDQPIYRYAEIQGKRYQFDFAYADQTELVLQDWQRYIPPGLVYRECKSSEPVSA